VGETEPAGTTGAATGTDAAGGGGATTPTGALAAGGAATEADPLDAELRDDARFERRLLVREIALILFVAAVVVARSVAGFG
jgi:hypothetical protein